MPVHDWTRVKAGIFHAFHHDWITELSRALNRGVLPPAYYALPEQLAGDFGPDVLTLHRPGTDGSDASPAPPMTTTAVGGGVALAVAPPAVRVRVRPSEASRYASRAKAVAVRHVTDHRVVAMVEVVSPGNKGSRAGMDAFARKARDVLAAGVHLLLVDLFPPGARDPQGIHRAVWGDDWDDDFAQPADKPLACVAYVGGAGAEAFIEPVAVGDVLPDMPLFLTPDVYVRTPLEPTYLAAWEGLPAYWRGALASAHAPPPPRPGT
jgi:hypothetical protein